MLHVRHCMYARFVVPHVDVGGSLRLAARVPSALPMHEDRNGCFGRSGARHTEWNIACMQWQFCSRGEKTKAQYMGHWKHAVANRSRGDVRSLDDHVPRSVSTLRICRNRTPTKQMFGMLMSRMQISISCYRSNSWDSERGGRGLFVLNPGVVHTSKAGGCALPRCVLRCLVWIPQAYMHALLVLELLERDLQGEPLIVTHAEREIVHYLSVQSCQFSKQQIVFYKETGTVPS